MEDNEIKLLPITEDFTFKRVFSYEGNEDVLIDLLEAILEIKIKWVKVKNPEILPRKKGDKKAILDIKAEIDDGSIIDIEMQAQDRKDTEERASTYLTMITSEILDSGEEYNRLRKVIVIEILNYENYKINGYHHISKMMFEPTDRKAYVDMGYKKEDKIASKFLEMHFIELPKYRKKMSEMKTKLDEWMYFFFGKKERIEMAIKKNSKIRKAFETIKMLSLSPKEREMYDAIKVEKFLENVGKENVRKEAMSEGISEGEKSREIEIVRKMLERGDKIKDIVDVTGLTKEEIEKIKDEE